MLYRSLVVGFALMAVWIEPALTVADTLVSVEQTTQQTVALRNITLQNGVISGEVVNNSPRPLRDVQLFIRHIWHWNNEFRPGNDDLGLALYYTVEKEIPPGGTVPFTYRQLSPLPARTDGYFETEVSVAGFAQIVEQ